MNDDGILRAVTDERMQATKGAIPTVHGGHVAIITPLFHVQVSGAAIYYNVLANRLLDSGCRVTVFSDREAGTFRGEYVGLFPARAGRNKQVWRDLLRYGLQNLNYLSLPGAIGRIRPDKVLIHSSFLNFPGLFGSVLSHLRHAAHRPTIILDVRDRLLPASRRNCLELVDHIVACSENVAQHLRHLGANPQTVIQIPVIQPSFRADADAQARLLARLGLTRGSYLLYVGAMKESKGIKLLLDSYMLLPDSTRKKLPLVLVGPIKTKDSAILRLVGLVRYIGPQSHGDAMCLMEAAALCVNLSPCEGLPRASLDALAVGARALLPPNVPEFTRHCPAHVVTESEPQIVAERINWALRSPSPRYPIDLHQEDVVFRQYIALLGS